MRDARARASADFFAHWGAARVTSNERMLKESANARGAFELNRLSDFSSVFLRFALGSAFLSAVADRFGLWGAFGRPNVAWGDFSHFTAYTAKLNWFVPQAAVPALAWIATGAELLFGVALILGLFTRATAFLSGLLLLSFALAMTLALGVKAPLNLSVFTAAAGAFLLAAQRRFPWSIDAIRESKRRK